MGHVSMPKDVKYRLLSLSFLTFYFNVFHAPTLFCVSAAYVLNSDMDRCSPVVVVCNILRSLSTTYPCAANPELCAQVPYVTFCHPAVSSSKRSECGYPCPLLQFAAFVVKMVLVEGGSRDRREC